MFRGVIVAALLAASVPLPAAGQTCCGDARERLVATMRHAIERSPDAALLEASARAQAASWRADTRLGPPWLEVQREGIRGFFDGNALNAIWYVRLGLPFRLPGGPSGSRLAEQIDAWLGPNTRAGQLQRAAAAGRLWLQAASQLERIEVHEQRVALIVRALEVQRTRLRVGEVAGYAVTQLELKRVNESVTLQRERAGWTELLSALRATTGGDLPAPEAGDLFALEAAAVGVPAPDVLRARVVDTAFVQAARERALAQSRWGEWVAARVWGAPSVNLEYEHVPRIDGAPSDDAWGFLVNVPLPFGGYADDRRLAASEQTAAAQAEAARVELETYRRAEAAHGLARAASASLGELAPLRQRVPEIERSLGEQFRLGAIGYLEYIDGLQRLDDLLLNDIGARLDRLLANLDLAALLDDPALFPLPTESFP